MKLIVGLGNPGSTYDSTRHNAGRRLVEKIAQTQSAVFQKKSGLKASVVSLDWDHVPVVLAFPDMFMNVSGEAVSLLVRHFSVDCKTDLLIAVDDLDLPFGKLRLRGKGSDGGHNGLKSIQQFLDTMDFARLRIGIGNAGPVPAEDYVLSTFSAEEKAGMEDVLKRGMEACRLWVTQPLERAMTSVNTHES